MFRRYIRIYIYFLSSTSTFNIFRSLPNRPLQSLPHSFHKHYHHRNVIHTLRGIFSVFINTLLRAYFLCPPYTAQRFPRLVKNLRLSLWPFCSISWDYSTGERMNGSATPATVFVRHINLTPPPPPLYIPCPRLHIAHWVHRCWWRRRREAFHFSGMPVHVLWARIMPRLFLEQVACKWVLPSARFRFQPYASADGDTGHTGMKRFYQKMPKYIIIFEKKLRCGFWD